MAKKNYKKQKRKLLPKEGKIAKDESFVILLLDDKSTNTTIAGYRLNEKQELQQEKIRYFLRT